MEKLRSPILTNIHTNIHTHTHTLSLSHTQVYKLIFIHTQTRAHIRTFSLTHIHTHTLSLSLSHLATAVTNDKHNYKSACEKITDLLMLWSRQIKVTLVYVTVSHSCCCCCCNNNFILSNLSIQNMTNIYNIIHTRYDNENVDWIQQHMQFNANSIYSRINWARKII